MESLTKKIVFPMRGLKRPPRKAFNYLHYEGFDSLYPYLFDDFSLHRFMKDSPMIFSLWLDANTVQNDDKMEIKTKINVMIPCEP
jgi:hypothetical protein